MKELNDDGTLVDALIFNELAGEHPDLFTFEPSSYLAPPEPWMLTRNPLRQMFEDLTGTTDVTNWTAQNAEQLRDILYQPIGEHASLLGLRESATEQLPRLDAGTGVESREEVSAESA